ncbi:hypothetical protein Tco_0366494 [Tanacetum coccineum]
MDELESDDGLVDTTLVSPFLDSDDESDDGEVLNELDECGNAGNFYGIRIINSLDGEDLAFPCMIGFRKFVAYFEPFLPMNIITRKDYNTIMVEGLKSTRRNLVAIVRDAYVSVGSFTFVMDFVVLEDIEEFIVSDMADLSKTRSLDYLNSSKVNLISDLEYQFEEEETEAMVKNIGFRSSRKLFKTPSLDESSSLEFDLFSDLEGHSEEEIAATMLETMEEYMSKTRGDYGLGVTRP